MALGAFSHSSVEPTTSVSTNETTPVGNAATATAWHRSPTVGSGESNGVIAHHPLGDGDAGGDTSAVCNRTNETVVVGDPDTDQTRGSTR
jgi:hypothetical protein